VSSGTNELEQFYAERQNVYCGIKCKEFSRSFNASRVVAEATFSAQLRPKLSFAHDAGSQLKYAFISRYSNAITGRLEHRCAKNINFSDLRT